MTKSLFLGLLFFLVPLEKLNIYYAGGFSITIKFYFIVLPVIYYYFFKKISGVFLYNRSCDKLIFYISCWGVLILLAVTLSILYLNGGSGGPGPSLYRLFAIVLFLAVVWSIDNYNEILTIKKAYILAGIVSAIFAYYQGGMFFMGSEVGFFDFTMGSGGRRLGYAATMALPNEGGTIRLNGFNYDPNLLAITLIIAIVSATSFVPGQVKTRFIYILAVLFMLPALAATFSRSGYLILGILFVFLFLRYWRVLFSVKGVMLSSILTVIMVAIAIIFSEEILHRFGASGSKSDHYHMLFGYGAFMLGLDHWLLGHGIGNFENVFLLSEYNIYSGLTRANPHSLPLTIFFELGIIGLIFYIGLVLYVVVMSIKTKANMRVQPYYDLWLFRILFLTLILHNMFNDYFHVELFVVFFAFYVALLNITRKKSRLTGFQLAIKESR